MEYEYWNPPAGWERGRIQIPILRRFYPTIIAEEIIAEDLVGTRPIDEKVWGYQKKKNKIELPEELFHIEY